MAHNQEAHQGTPGNDSRVFAYHSGGLYKHLYDRDEAKILQCTGKTLKELSSPSVNSADFEKPWYGE